MHILLPVDGSEASATAVRLVTALADGRPSAFEPILVNIQRPLVQAWPKAHAAWEVMERALYERGQALLAAPLESMTAAGLQAQAVVRVGVPATAILELGDERRAALIVMGTRGHGLVSGFALGSVALRVAPGASCPVVLVKSDTRLPAAGRSRLHVVLPVDGSPLGSAAVDQLLALRDLFGEMHVDLAHFQPPLTVFESIMPPHNDVLRNWSGTEREDAIAAAVARLAGAGMSHEVHRQTGDPAPGIAEFARSRGTDLIAMATHGTGVLHHAAFGSVTLKTVALADVPVLVMAARVGADVQDA